jgi:hypothetical protein
MLLVALAAGLWSGPRAGMLLGAGVGMCDAALFGGNFSLLVLIGLACGGLASVVTRWLSRRHLLVGLLTALAASVLIRLLLAWPYDSDLVGIVVPALHRAGVNVMWMIPIYGVVLLSSRGSTTASVRE